MHRLNVFDRRPPLGGPATKIHGAVAPLGEARGRSIPPHAELWRAHKACGSFTPQIFIFLLLSFLPILLFSLKLT